MALDLYHNLREKGFCVWYDVKMTDKALAAMEQGVKNSLCVIAIITPGNQEDPDSHYFRRPYCIKECQWALESGVKVQPVVHGDHKKRIGEFMSVAPPSLQGLEAIEFVDLHQSDVDYFKVGVSKIIKAIQP